MSKYSNIYDIDGNIIRRADQGKFTLEEVEQLVDDLTKKVQDNPDNNVYKVYLNNAQKWLMHMYDNMSKEDIMKRLSILKNSAEDAKQAQNEAEQAKLDEISKAMEELKAEYDKENLTMDEYVEPIEEDGERTV